jgi:hypothetical protein
MREVDWEMLAMIDEARDLRVPNIYDEEDNVEEEDMWTRIRGLPDDRITDSFNGLMERLDAMGLSVTGVLRTQIGRRTWVVVWEGRGLPVEKQPALGILLFSRILVRCHWPFSLLIVRYLRRECLCKKYFKSHCTILLLAVAFLLISIFHVDPNTLVELPYFCRFPYSRRLYNQPPELRHAMEHIQTLPWPHLPSQTRFLRGSRKDDLRLFLPQVLFDIFQLLIIASFSLLIEDSLDVRSLFPNSLSQSITNLTFYKNVLAIVLSTILETQARFFTLLVFHSLHVILTNSS